jgi:hypothetical protein
MPPKTHGLIIHQRDANFKTSEAMKLTLLLAHPALEALWWGLLPDISPISFPHPYQVFKNAYIASNRGLFHLTL